MNLEYTAIFDCPVELIDELFMDALTWKLAAKFAPALIKGVDGIQAAAAANAAYLQAMDLAAAVGEREQQQDPPGDAEWIDARA